MTISGIQVIDPFASLLVGTVGATNSHVTTLERHMYAFVVASTVKAPVYFHNTADNGNAAPAGGGQIVKRCVLSRTAIILFVGYAGVLEKVSQARNH